MMRIVGLHKLPSDEVKLRNYLADSPPDFAIQARKNWENAWIIVVEVDAGTKIDFGEFAHPEPGLNAQSPWLEMVLEEGATRTVAAFFMHYIDAARPLWYGAQAYKLPSPTPAPPELVSQLQYMSPD